MDILTVTEYNNAIKNILLINYNDDINIEGEIANYKTYGSTLYFSIKDSTSLLNCCAWNWHMYSSDTFQVGDKIQVTGKTTVYLKMGYFQVNVKKIKKLGSDISQYENLKLYYDNLGYFNKKRKINYADNICIITAQDGAALQDIIATLKNGDFRGSITVKNALVQGKDCANSISNSLKLMDSFNFDLIIVTRGGGSYEDLTGFNDPQIVETLYNTNTITVSAIGHEIDNVLTDLVADIRAATPTMAANVVLKHKLDINDYFTKLNVAKNRIKNRFSYVLDKLNNYKQLIIENNSINCQIREYDNQKNRLIDLNKKYKNVVLNNILNIKKKINSLEHIFNSSKIVDTKLFDTNGTPVRTKQEFIYNRNNSIKMELVFKDGSIFI